MMTFIHHESSNTIGGQNAVNIRQTDRQTDRETRVKMFFKTKRTLAAEIDLALLTCSREGPNTSSM